MRFYPTKIYIAFLCFIFISISLNIGCSKDSDLLFDTVVSDSETAVDVQERTRSSSESTEETNEVAENSEVVNNDELEVRTTSFSPLHDAHMQSGRGYNQNIIRLEEGSRTSYLMFDLSEIAAISGTISEATLQFTIDSDDGSGTVNVYRGTSSEWTENTLSDESAPEAVIQIGSISKAFNIGETQVIELDITDMLAEVKTLILQHKDGNDLAFASKEHASKIGPKLVISYEVAESAEEIGDSGISEETNENQDSTEENNENQQPMAVADASPASGGVPLAVTFQGDNSSDDKKVVSYLWDFKDGATSNELNPTHTFDQIGEYQVELSVTDEEGLVNTDVVTITVNSEQNEGPKAVATASPLSGEVPLEVNFVGSQSTDDNGIASYSWDFKDGSKTNVADFTYTYTKVGTYQAELTVTDENGLTDIQTVTIEVKESSNNKPNAVASADLTSGPAPLNVQFTGDKSTDDKGIYSYAWNFKDGSAIQYVANPSHTFNQAGSYEVELIVTDTDGEEDKETIVIEVTANENAAPNAVASANVTSGGAPLTVQFSGDSSTDDSGITSYFWNFKDGLTGTTPNPSHTFTQAGSYVVDLTVKDAQGLSNTTSITITVNSPNNNTGGNAPPGYYVSENGSSANNGTSSSAPWSLAHALNVARPGDIIYVKAGTYRSSTFVAYQSGTSSQPIKIIGYRNSPGDIKSNGASTFEFGETVSASKMPLILGNSTTSGIGLDLNGGYFHLENIQVSNYGTGVNSKGTGITLKNIIVSKIGQQNNNSTNNGKGIIVSGNNSLLENCFVLNSNSQGINIKGANSCKITNCKVYSNNYSNPTGYYLLISNGGSYNVVDNCTIYRDPNADVHRGHGLVLKDAATNNIIRNSRTYNTGIEVNFSGVHSNRFDNVSLNGSYPSDRGEFTSNIRVLNGAHSNTFNNITISNALYAVNFHDFDDGFTASNGDRDKQEGGSNNIFTGLKVNNVTAIVSATSEQVGAQAFSRNNKFSYCSFENVSSVPFVSFQNMTGTVFTSCTFKNISSYVAIKTFNGGTFQSSFPSSSWSNVGFTPPN